MYSIYREMIYCPGRRLASASTDQIYLSYLYSFFILVKNKERFISSSVLATEKNKTSVKRIILYYSASADTLQNIAAHLSGLFLRPFLMTGSEIFDDDDDENDNTVANDTCADFFFLFYTFLVSAGWCV